MQKCIIFVLFCDSLFPITKPGILQLCPEQMLKAQTFPRSNESDTTDQDEQLVEGFNVTYSFTLSDRELYTAKFKILGSDGIIHNINFSMFYSILMITVKVYCNNYLCC